MNEEIYVGAKNVAVFPHQLVVNKTLKSEFQSMGSLFPHYIHIISMMIFQVLNNPIITKECP
jgi:hypothetical protein